MSSGRIGSSPFGQKMQEKTNKVESGANFKANNEGRDGYMTKDEYKQLIKKYMDEFNVSYITAKQYLLLEQIQQFEHDKKIKYEKAFLDTYNEIVENGYNISLL